MLKIISQHINERNQEEIISLIKTDPSILDRNESGKASIFMMLAYHGLQEAFLSAIELKRSFSFYEAIISGNLDMVKNKMPKAIDSFSEDGFTGLSLAAYFGQNHIAKHLLYHGSNPDINSDNPSKVNALHAAVAQENIGLVKLFLNHNASVDSTQMQNVTALHSAVRRGNLELIQLLLRYGANIKAKMANGEDVIDIAKKEGHHEILSFLTSKIDPMKVIDKIAWIELKDKKLLSTRSKGKSAYYIPGGKRDPGETDKQTLIREIKEELSVDCLDSSIKYLGTYRAQADGHKDGIIVKMTCYSALYIGTLLAASEIEEVKWLTYDDYDKVSHVDKVIFDHLKYLGKM